ncbi:MAG: CaiB/BaiF CoA transferase family protein [Alphaproteobacteria bacterium]
MQSCLDGIRVLELAEGWSAGAICGRMLSELGADVCKLEPVSGDRLRRWPPQRAGADSAAFLNLATGKSSLALSLDRPQAPAIVDRLLAGADVVVAETGFLADYGLDIGEARRARLNPRLVACSFSAFGATGSMAGQRGGDLVAQAAAGVIATTGQPDTLPHRLGTPLAAYSGALTGGGAILAALYEREASGLGQSIDTALYDAMVSYLYTFIPGYFISGAAPKPQGNKHTVSAPWDTYAAKDGWVIICTVDDRQWHAFLRLAGRADLIDSPRYKGADERTQPEIRAEVDALVSAFVADKPVAEAVRLLAGQNIPVGPINQVPDLFDDPQFLGRGMVATVDHPQGAYRATGSIFKMSETPGRLGGRAPLLGEGGADRLRDWCGGDAAWIDGLARAGLLHSPAEAA